MSHRNFIHPKNISSYVSNGRHRGQSELVRTIDEPDWVYTTADWCRMATSNQRNGSLLFSDYRSTKKKVWNSATAEDS